MGWKRGRVIGEGREGGVPLINLPRCAYLHAHFFRRRRPSRKPRITVTACLVENPPRSSSIARTSPPPPETTTPPHPPPKPSLKQQRRFLPAPMSAYPRILSPTLRVPLKINRGTSRLASAPYKDHRPAAAHVVASPERPAHEPPSSRPLTRAAMT